MFKDFKLRGTAFVASSMEKLTKYLSEIPFDTLPGFGRYTPDSEKGFEEAKVDKERTENKKKKR